MKHFITLLTLICITTFGFSQRKQGYDNDSRWFWTLNAGTTWNKSDVKSVNDWGWGLTIGKSFNYNYGKLLSFDIRGRFLSGNWYGQANDTTSAFTPNSVYGIYQDSLGYTVLNHWTRVREASLELVIHANKFRERTGWDLYVFGGIGVSAFKTNGNLKGENGYLYQYDSLANFSSGTLSTFLDDTYETTLDGSTAGQANIALVPSLGFGIGYQFAPRFSMGLEHKTTFTQLDHFDGYNALNGNYENDWYHYTSAYMRFHLRKKNIEVTTDIVSEDPPVVTFTNPRVSGLEVSDPQYTVTALIKNVSTKEGINFRQNGNFVSNFYFNDKNDRFTSYVTLQPGQNVFEIVATNAYGSDQKTTIVIYKREQITAPPVVTFLNPNMNPLTTSSPQFNVNASILNVQQANQISYTVNGQTYSNFNFNAAQGKLGHLLNLQIGSNVVTITATNTAGSDTKSTTIIYNPVQTEALPTVHFTLPRTSPHRTNSSSMELKANIAHVSGSENVIFKQNGQQNNNFTYNATTDHFTSNVVLQPGQNVFELIGTNTSGSASASMIIVYEVPAPKPPIVSITNPATCPFTTQNNQFTLNASILNVASKSQIQLVVNGKPFSNFSYNTQTNSLSANLNLVEGANTIVVSASNNDGKDGKNCAIVYTKPVQQIRPEVTFINPNSSPYTTFNNQYTVEASVLNVDNSTGINVTVNGANFNGFSFNSNSKQLTFPLSLIEGVNIITVTGTNAVGVDSKTTTIKYTKQQVVLPPTVTFIDPIQNPFTIYQNNYFVKANVQHIDTRQDIEVKVNGIIESNFNFEPSSGMLAFNTGLVLGSNSIEIKAQNPSGIDIENTTIIYRMNEVQKKPIVQIINPIQNNKQVSSPSYPIQANVLNVDNTQNMEVYVNNQLFSGFSYNTQTKQLSFEMPLQEGNNNLLIKARNLVGEAQDTRVIIYKKEIKLDPPFVSYLNPSQSGSTTSNPHLVLKAQITNITSVNQVELTQNGNVVNRNLYTYDINTRDLIFNTSLNPGNNVFVITANNLAGNHAASTSIIYNPIEVPCDKPVITYINPATDNSILNSNKLNLKAKITGVDNQNKITIKINGISKSGFTFNAVSGILDFASDIIDEQNTIEIIAKNNCGETSKSIIIKVNPRDKPCDNPSINVINPSLTDSKTEMEYQEIKMVISNIDAKEKITFKFNGVDHIFSYNPGSHILIAKVSLNVGKNSVQVQAANACSSAGVSLSIERLACNPPVLNLNSSSLANNTTTFNEQVSLLYAVTNIDNRNELTVTQNNNPISFVFNELAKTIQISANLQLNSNTFKIVAINKCGENTSTFQVTRNERVVVKPPVVKITNPASTPFNTQEGAINIHASIENITTASQLSMLVNGNVVNPTINFTNGTLTYNMSLNEGNNTVSITGVNESGTSSDSKVIIYTKPVTYEKPRITLLNPSSCPIQLEKGTHQITGYITNLTIANQAQFKVNNQPINNVNPTFSNGKLNFNFTVNLSTAQSTLTLQINAQNPAGSDVKICQITMKEEVDNTSCLPQITTNFTNDTKAVAVSSTKDLSNVVLKFHDGTTQKFDNLSGKTGIYRGTGTFANKCIVGVWVKSGCNQSNDGPGYGEWFASSFNQTTCETNAPEDCKAKINAQFLPNAKRVNVTSDKNLENVVLKFMDGQQQMFNQSNTKQASLQGTGVNAGKCIVGVWVKSGCNGTNDGPNYGEYINNSGYSNQCAAEEDCGPRINPGNSQDEFCLITPSGNITRDNLTANANFTYNGPATSIYFKPIAGGGNVTVNGSPYTILPGNTYRFDGTLSVELKNPNNGGNGHWVVCITSNVQPTFGKGNKKPQSPCVVEPNKVNKPTTPTTPTNKGGNKTPTNPTNKGENTPIRRGGN